MNKVIGFYGSKGGQGCTVTACAYALSASLDAPTLLVDASDNGDVLHVLGLSDSQEQTEVTESLIYAEGLSALTDPQYRTHESIVVDFGTTAIPENFPGDLMLVIRPCYLAVRRSAESATVPTGVIVLDEQGRALTPADVAKVLETPACTVIKTDPAVARAVDAGVFATRVPKSLQGLRQAMAGNG